MNIYCVKGVAAYHEFSCACMQCVQLTIFTLEANLTNSKLHTMFIFDLI
jgi:hypothetical protein